MDSAGGKGDSPTAGDRISSAAGGKNKLQILSDSHLFWSQSGNGKIRPSTGLLKVCIKQRNPAGGVGHDGLVPAGCDRPEGRPGCGFVHASCGEIQADKGIEGYGPDDITGRD